MTQSRPVGERTRCRSCGAPIFWMETNHGKLMPVDTKMEYRLVMVQAEDDLVLSGRGDEADYIRVRQIPTYLSHFATCENPEEFI